MHVFGYGSLLWYTNFPYEEAIPGVVKDYVRRFCQLSPDHRGTPEKPGRVVSLVPKKGGHCWGIAYKVPEKDIESTVEYLNFRERAGYNRSRVMFYPDNGSEPFELEVYISCSEAENIYHSTPVDEEEIVKQIIRCKGFSGSNLEYALRLADCQRRMAPHHYDDHLFGIESRLLELCKYLSHEDEILEKLNHKLDYKAKNTNNIHKASNRKVV